MFVLDLGLNSKISVSLVFKDVLFTLSHIELMNEVLYLHQLAYAIYMSLP